MATLVSPRRFAVSPVHIVAVLIIGAAVWLAATNLGSSFRTYVTTVDEATANGRSVQLAGYLGSLGEYDAEGRFTFLLKDERGELLRVVSNEPRPANFEQAISVVAIGHYDAGSDAFMADKLLIKCPSKYQEQQAGGV